MAYDIQELEQDLEQMKIELFEAEQIFAKEDLIGRKANVSVHGMIKHGHGSNMSWIDSITRTTYRRKETISRAISHSNQRRMNIFIHSKEVYMSDMEDLISRQLLLGHPTFFKSTILISALQTRRR